MIDLDINIDELAADFAMTQQDRDNLIEFAVNNVAGEYKRSWQKESRKLFKSRSQYFNAIQSRKVDNKTTVVYLNPDAWLPNAVETGVSGFDMKVGFLKSSKVKYTQGGDPYLTIPFRFAQADSIGEREDFAGVLPKSIQKAINTAVKQPNQNRGGLKLDSIERRFQMPESAELRARMRNLKMDLSKFDQNLKATSMYEGLVKNDKGGGYVAFRRVSLNSPKERFQHSGITARDLSGQAMTKFEPEIFELIGRSIDNYLGL